MFINTESVYLAKECFVIRLYGSEIICMLSFVTLTYNKKDTIFKEAISVFLDKQLI